VYDLVLHIVTNTEDHVVERRYIDNFFHGSACGANTCTMLDYLLNETSEFDDMDTIYFTGDTGNGFRSWRLANYFSARPDGRKYVQVFLCPRHAYSLCDAHLAVCGCPIHNAKIGGNMNTSDQFKKVVDESYIQNTRTYDFGELEEIDPDAKKKYVTLDSTTGIRKVTHLEFPYGPGWAIGREVSGIGPWFLFNLSSVKWQGMQNKKGLFCRKCSEAAVKPVPGHVDYKLCPRYRKKGVGLMAQPLQHPEILVWDVSKKSIGFAFNDIRPALAETMAEVARGVDLSGGGARVLLEEEKEDEGHEDERGDKNVEIAFVDVLQLAEAGPSEVDLTAAKKKKKVKKNPFAKYIVRGPKWYGVKKDVWVIWLNGGVEGLGVGVIHSVTKKMVAITYWGNHADDTKFTEKLQECKHDDGKGWIVKYNLSDFMPVAAKFQLDKDGIVTEEVRDMIRADKRIVWNWDTDEVDRVLPEDDSEDY
jgi:hypothetical protein